MKSCVITGAARTAVGSYLGSLKTVAPEILGAAVIREVIARADLAVSQVDAVILGQVLADGEARNIARISGLLAGLGQNTPGYTVDLQCGSGLQAVRLAVQEIQTGAAEIVVAGGTESMSRAIYYLPPSARYENLRLGGVQLYDAFVRGAERVQPPDLYPNLNMGITAENVAALHRISRDEQDAFALHSQQKACAAIQAGRFREEIVQIEVRSKKGSFFFDTDEYPRPEATIESLAKLKPVFQANGTVTAGNASGMNDGASAAVVMSAEKAQAMGIQPLARILEHAVTALDPKIMGLGPVSAIRKVLLKAGLELEDIDLFEINEAFSAQSLGVLKELGMEPGSSLYERVNVNGGAVALGHALGSSGTRLLNTLIYELKRRKGRYGIASLCIGGGQGIAMLVEAV